MCGRDPTRRQFIAAGAAGLAFGPAFWRSALDAQARAAAERVRPAPARRRARAHAPARLQLARDRARQPARQGLPVAHLLRRPGDVLDPRRRLGAGLELRVDRARAAPAARPCASGPAARSSPPTGSSAARTPTARAAARRGARGCRARSTRPATSGSARPAAPGQGTIRPALGSFNHEAVAVDPVRRQLYLTEDQPDGGLYRFTPTAYPDLTAGRLEVMTDSGWAEVPDPAAVFTATRKQVPNMRSFSGGEGIWFDSGTIYFSTKGDNRVWAYDTAAGTLGTVYEGGGPLTGVDNLTVSGGGRDLRLRGRRRHGDLRDRARRRRGAVPEADRGGRRRACPGAATSWPAWSSIRRERRLYFAAQRAYGFGAVYEVTGPFHRPARVPGSAPVAQGLRRPRAARRGARAAADLARARCASAACPWRSGSTSPASCASPCAPTTCATSPASAAPPQRPQTVTLDRRRRASARAGRHRIRLRVSAAEARRLRRARRVDLQVAVVVKLGSGVRQVETRRVRLR